MAITALNGTQNRGIDDSVEITYNIKMVSGLYLYVYYDKIVESEDGVELKFQVYDEKHPREAWFYISGLNGSGAVTPISYKLITAGGFVIPISTPESAELLTVIFSYLNGSSGNVDVWANTTNKYS
jgi:hypothetical protein